MASSDSFGAQHGFGVTVAKWLNEEVIKLKKDAKTKLYGHIIKTSRFGKFEMLLWNGDISVARDLIIRASKRYKIKTLEGGYKPSSFFSFSVENRDYTKVHYRTAHPRAPPPLEIREVDVHHRVDRGSLPVR